MPALIFALGMYLPLELNTPALVGGMLAHFVGKRSERAGGEAGRTMRERAVIIASGLMAGGALGGVFGAALRLFAWYREDLDQAAVLRQRRRSRRWSVRAAFVGAVRLPLVRRDEEGQGGVMDRLSELTATPSSASTRSGAAT